MEGKANDVSHDALLSPHSEFSAAGPKLGEPSQVTDGLENKQNASYVHVQPGEDASNNRKSNGLCQGHIIWVGGG